MKVEVKNLEGKSVGEIDLKEDVFGLKVNDELVHQVYVAQYANRRSVVAHTKTRGEVRGSGRKPWRQKGTGRARTGDVQNPIWRKGGIVFGPRSDRNYKKKVNKKMGRLAVKMVLSGKLAEKKLIIVDSFAFPEIKTKLAQQFVDSLGLKSGVLMVFGEKEMKYSLATRNLMGVRNVAIQNLSVFEMLNAKFMIISKDEILSLEKKLLKN